MFSVLIGMLFSLGLFSQSCVEKTPYTSFTYYYIPSFLGNPVDIKTLDKDVVWAISQLDITRTTDGGCTWKAVDFLSSPPLFDSSFLHLYALDSMSAWVVGQTSGNNPKGFVAHTLDGGSSWQFALDTAYQTPGNTPQIVHFFDPAHGVILGSNRNFNNLEIYTTSDGGASWGRVPADSLPTLNSDFWLRSREYVAFGDTILAPLRKGKLLRSVDKGVHWSAVTVDSIPSGAIPSIACHHSGDMMMAYHNIYPGLLYRSADGGLNWEKITIEQGPDFSQGPMRAGPYPGTYFSGYYGSNNGVVWTNYYEEAYFIYELTQPYCFQSPDNGWMGGAQGMQRWNGEHLKLNTPRPPYTSLTPRQFFPQSYDWYYINLYAGPLHAETQFSIQLNGMDEYDENLTIAAGNWSDRGNFSYLLSPMETGQYKLNWDVNFQEAGIDTVFSAEFTLSDSILSRSYPHPDGTLILETGQGVCSGFDIQQQDTLTGLSFYCKSLNADPNAGSKYYMGVFKVSDETGEIDLFNPLWISATRSLNAGQAEQWVYVPLDSFLILQPGFYWTAVFSDSTAGNVIGVGEDPTLGDWTRYNITPEYFYTSTIPASPAPGLRVHLITRKAPALGVHLAQSASLKLWPNPARDQVEISLGNEADGAEALVQIYDQLGQRIASRPGNLSSGRGQLSLAGLPAGRYLIEVIIGAQRFSNWVTKY